MRIGSKHLTDRAHRVRPGIDEVLDAVLPRGDHARSVRHAPVRDGRSIFDHQRATAGNQ